MLGKQVEAERGIVNKRPKIAPSDLPHVLKIFLVVDLVLLAAAGITESVCRLMLHLGYPYSSPLLFEYFPDLVNLRDRFAFFHTLRFFTEKNVPPFMYPAPVAVLYRLIYLFRPYDIAAYLCFALASFFIAAAIFEKALVRRGLSRYLAIPFVSAVFLTAYPLWFVCRQANMEIFVWVLLSLGLYCFFKDRGYSAGALIGIAGAMKIFPFIYLGLMLARRQYRQCCFALVAAVAVTIPSLWLVYPHVLESWRLTNIGVAQFRTLIMLHVFAQSSFDHSLFGLIKSTMHPLWPPQTLNPILTACLGLSALVGVGLYVFRIRYLPVANQLLCLCVASILFPPTSFDYTLIHLYAPWAVLVFFSLQQENRSRKIPGLTAVFVCFAILFVPETEMIVRAHSGGGQIKALTLIALFTLGLLYPFDALDRNEAVATA